MKRSLLLSCLFGLGCAVPVVAQQRPAPANDAALAPNAPADRPFSVTAKPAETTAAVAACERHIAPAFKQARATMPQAKRRFLQGLPSGQVFFLTTRLSEPGGNFEQVFVRVKQWQGGQISGLIVSQLGILKTYKEGQLITFPESAVLDWTISRPDGTEEGNYVGKLIDADKR